jgi:hypothetical protein
MKKIKHIILKLFNGVFKLIVIRNSKFKNIHRGEEAYLIGNGPSLRDVDLQKFANKITIGCNHLAIHRDFDKLNLKYMVLPEPFFAYPFIINQYNKKIQINIFGKIFKIANKKSNAIIFTNLSNILGFLNRKYYFFYSFGESELNIRNSDLSHKFAFGGSALNAMIGVAKYMGIKKVYLLGCDNTFMPSTFGHFYSLGHRQTQKGADCVEIEANYKSLRELIEIEVIVERGSTSEYFNYKENEFEHYNKASESGRDIIKKEHIFYLEKARKAGLYMNKIFK